MDINDQHIYTFCNAYIDEIKIYTVKVYFQNATKINSKEAFSLFLYHIKKHEINELLLYSPTKARDFQTQWIKEVLGKTHYDKLMSTTAKTKDSGYNIYFRTSNTLNTNRMYISNLGILCYYPSDKEFEQLRDLNPSIIFIYGDLIHLPETAMDYDLEEN